MNFPPKGFYIHYKNKAYEVIGIARHSETAEITVLYRPLYKNTWLSPADYCARPLEMFLGNVEIDGKMVPRFKKIEDEKLIEKLKLK